MSGQDIVATANSQTGRKRWLLIGLVTTWMLAFAACLASSLAWQVLKDYLAQCPPPLFGILPVGICLQVVVTFIGIKDWKRSASVGLAFAFGYWTCALVSLVAAYWFVARGTLIASP